MLTIALICACSFVSFAIAECSIPPIYLDIHARDVEGTNNAVSYGAYINVGNPIQQLSLWPSLEINETTLADTKFCSTPSCTADSAHGLFDPTKSTSFTNTPPTHLDNVSTLTKSISTLSESGTDILHLWSNLIPNTTASATNLTGFPLQLLSNYSSPADPFFGPAGLVGLGPSSSILSSLLKDGRIASRSYGLFVGSAYPRNNATRADTNTLNGSLTLGGYDAARFQNPVQSFPISSSDSDSTGALSVPVSSISLSTSASNSTANLLHTPFTAHLSTAQYELTLPSSLANPLASAPNQTLRITLGSNLTISLSSSWLATQPLKYSTSGPFILGTSLLSSLYLTVSYDSTPPMFFLAPATSEAGYVAPVPLCGGDMPVPQGTAKLSFFVKNGLVGLIVGASIAVCAVGVLVVGCGGWRCCCRGRREKEAGSKGEEMEMRWMDERGDGYGNEAKAKGSKVQVVEKTEKGRSAAADWDEDSSMYFAPPPRRGTVLVEKKEKKMGLKGILKVKIPGQGMR